LIIRGDELVIPTEKLIPEDNNNLDSNVINI